MSEDLFNATICEGVVAGHCVMMDDEMQVVYGGPIKTAPDIAGKLVLLNAADFEKLKTAVERKRH